jgi:hypothetical protein
MTCKIAANRRFLRIVQSLAFPTGTGLCRRHVLDVDTTTVQTHAGVRALRSPIQSWASTRQTPISPSPEAVSGYRTGLTFPLEKRTAVKEVLGAGSRCILSEALVRLDFGGRKPAEGSISLSRVEVRSNEQPSRFVLPQ